MRRRIVVSILFPFLLSIAALASEALIPDEVEQLTTQGVQKRDQQDYEGAVALFRQALAISPNDPRANFELAQVLARQGRYDEALDQVMSASSKAGAARALLHDLAGTILDFQGRFKEGEKEFRKAVELEPRVSFQVNLAANLVRQKRWGEAVEALRGAVERQPLHAPSWQAIAACFDRLGERSLAALAYWRFASLSDAPDRALEASERAWKLLEAVSGRDAEGNTKLNIDDPEQTSASGLLTVLRFAVDSPGEQKTTAAFLIEFLPDLASSEPEEAAAAGRRSRTKVRETARSYLRRQLRLYFEEVERRKLMPALVHSVRAPLGEGETTSWLEQHRDEVEALQSLSRTWLPVPVNQEEAKRSER